MEKFLDRLINRILGPTIEELVSGVLDNKEEDR